MGAWCLAYPITFLLCAACAALSFGRCGQHSPPHVLDVLQHGVGITAPVCDALLLLHHAVSYTLFQQVFAQEAAIWFAPTALRAGVLGRLLWLAITTMQLALTL